MTLTSAELRRELGQLVRAYQRQADPNLSLELFRILGWDGVDYRLEAGRADGGAREYRLAVAGETTAYLFIAPREPGDDIVRAAANVAYNSGIDWAAITNFGTTKLVHARWYDDPTYISLSWREYPQRVDELELLSPQAIIGGRLAERVQEERREKVLRPVDQHLMDRLESWRRLLLRNSGEVTDEQVHQLIGRLFFIRSCEDRGIVPGESLLALRSQASVDRPLGYALNQLFAQLAADFDSELFADPDGQPPLFDDGVLSEIIQELYSPFRGLPHYRYDFSYLNVDVLGKVYERYVSTVLERVPKQKEEDQLPLFDFGGTGQEVEARSRRREQGIYYTPPYIVNYIVQHTVERLLKEARSLDEFPRVADISCGSGAFLTRAAERMAARARELDQGVTESNWRRRVILRLAGVDADPRAVTLARVNLWILTTMGEPPRPLPELGASIIAADALTAPVVDALKEQLDVVVGNPPFRSAADLDRATQERLRRRYVSASGRFDLAYVFLERALQLVRPGGYVGFVLPNRLFTNADARFLRDLLGEAAIIEKVVDFGHVRAFEEGLSYTTIVIARKRAASVDRDATEEGAGDGATTTQVHRVRRLAEYPGLQLRRADLVDGTERRDEYSHIFTAPQPSGPGPWIWWASDVEDRIRQKLAAEALAVGAVAHLYQGVKTGDNRIFLLRRLGSDARTGRWIVLNGQGDRAELEPDLLRPCARGGVIGRYAIREDAAQGPVEYVLYPYRGGRLLDLFELEATFPATHAYLLKYKDRLLARSTVARGGAWYDLSWSRGDEWLDQPKVLTRELVPQAAFAADEQGQYVPIGGIALLPRKRAWLPMHLLLGVLNSSLMTWYLSYRAARFQQGYIKVVPGQLKAFMFPWDLLLSERGLAHRLATLAAGAARSAQLGLPTREAEEEIDAILFDVLGLDASEQEAVRDRVSRRPAEREVPTPKLFQVDALPPWPEQLTLVDRLLARAEQANSRRAREDALVQARDGLSAALRASDDQLPRRAASLLTFALLGAERLSRAPTSSQQIALLREVVGASRQGRVHAEMLATYERRLREAGIEVMLNMPGASVVMTTDPDEAEDDEADPRVPDGR